MIFPLVVSRLMIFSFILKCRLLNGIEYESTRTVHLKLKIIVLKFDL